MNFLQQKRTLIWILVFLVIFNLAAGLTIFLHIRSEKSGQVQNQETDLLKKELSLNHKQVQGLGRIRAQFRAISEPVAFRIRETRQALVDEMGKDRPDTLRLHQLSMEMGTLQAELTYQIAVQYLDIRDLCTPDQALKLNSNYKYLFGIDEQPRREGQGYRRRWGASGKNRE